MAAWLKTFNANVEGKQEPPVGDPIKDTDPDVCVFTEAYHCREHLKKVAENRGYVLKMFGKDLGEEGPDIAVLVRDTIKIVKWEPMKMSEPWWWNGNKREPRVYPKFLFEDPDLAPNLNWKYIAAHLPPGGPDGGKNGENKKAWRESQDRLVKYGNDHQDGPYLIAGDINALAEETKSQIAARLEGAAQVGSFGKVDHLVARRIKDGSMKMNRMDSPIGHGWGTGKVAAQDRDSSN
jgi:hypothetical protein